MNNKIIRINRDESDLTFVIKFPKGKSISDVEDVVFLVKEQDSSPLINALIAKFKSQGKITLSAPDIAVVKLEVSDYDNLTIDALYSAALFCKWTGNTDFDENVERLFDFQITQNFHNNN